MIGRYSHETIGFAMAVFGGTEAVGTLTVSPSLPV